MSELMDIANGVVSRAKGNEEIEVYVSRGHDTDVTAYDGDIESLSSADSGGVGVRVLLPSPDGARVGTAWAGSLEPHVIDAVLADARDNARFATPDPFMVLAKPDGVVPAEIDLWRDSFASVPTDKKVQLALDLEAAVRSGDPRIRQVEGASYGDASVEMALVSTAGISASARRTTAYLSIMAIAADGEDSQSGGGYSVGRVLDELDPEKPRRDAIERSVRLLGAEKIPTDTYNIVFDPEISSTLLALASSALSGEAVVRGRSFFANRVGESVAAPLVTLVDDPTDARMFSASALDAEGLASRRNVLIEQGVLRGFVYDTVSAARAGTTSTGSAVRGGLASNPGASCRALLLEPGELDQEGILKAVGEGILVTSLTGVHSGVNTISGDFSVGIEGLRFSNGTLGAPLREVTIGSTLQRLLLTITHIGNDLEWLPAMAAGQSIAISSVRVSGR